MKNNLIFSVIFCLLAIATHANCTSTATQIVHDFYAAIDAGNFDKAGTLLSDDLKVYIPFSPNAAMDKMSYKQLGMGMKAGFPDMQHKILETYEGQGTVTFKAHFSGTNTGSLQGNPPTGNHVEQTFLGLLKINKAGKISEFNIQFDLAGFNAQLTKGINPAEAKKSLANAIFDALNRHDLEAVVSKYSPTSTFNGWAPKTLDLNGYKTMMGSLLAAFPDAKFTIDDVVSDGDILVIRHHLQGTHKGDGFMDIKSTNKQVFVPATVTIHFKNGLPSDFWLNADLYGMMAQLGAIPMTQN